MSSMSSSSTSCAERGPNQHGFRDGRRLRGARPRARTSTCSISASARVILADARRHARGAASRGAQRQKGRARGPRGLMLSQVSCLLAWGLPPRPARGSASGPRADRVGERARRGSRHRPRPPARASAGPRDEDEGGGDGPAPGRRGQLRRRGEHRYMLCVAGRSAASPSLPRCHRARGTPHLRAHGCCAGPLSSSSRLRGNPAYETIHTPTLNLFPTRSQPAATTHRAAGRPRRARRHAHPACARPAPALHRPCARHSRRRGATTHAAAFWSLSTTCTSAGSAAATGSGPLRGVDLRGEPAGERGELLL
jgi:hypothetical protein